MFDLLPDEYKTKRPLHDDWFWPLSYIPRRWTGYPLPLPFKQLIGNSVERPRLVRPNYPLNGSELTLEGGKSYISGPDPIPPKPLGFTLQAVKLRKLWVPCYISFNIPVGFGYCFHFNGPVKPDMTNDVDADGKDKWDWYVWFEFSLGLRKA